MSSGKTSSGCTQGPLEFPKERKGRRDIKQYLKKKKANFSPKFDENCKFTDPRSSMISNSRSATN